MSENIIVSHCSPTLAGLKTGNMFNYSYQSKTKLLNDIDKFNSFFSTKGIKMVLLKITQTNALIYIYRQSKLEIDFKNELLQKILNSYGYPVYDVQKSIKYLSNRLKHTKDFPHEVGLFLGYPPEDVHGFISNKAQSAKCVGFWKVYSNEQQAVKTFAKYKKCTKIYKEQLQKGNKFERLVVAV